MNSTLEKQIRGDLKLMLEECTEAQQNMFKRMYAEKGNIEIDINKVVDDMDSAKLDHAYTQTERTLNNNQNKKDV